MLSDLVVVDLTRALAGPHASMMLADLGARVIKVEPPAGDDTRTWGPPFVGDDDVSTYFLSCNRNKESVTLDLKTDRGRETLTRLIRRADILIENYRPGVLDRLGFTASFLHETNPRLVVCSISGFGHDGPEMTRAGYDQIAQGEAGLMSVTGEPGAPTKVGVPIGDVLAGLHSVIGILAAVHDRSHTGRGRVVRTSLLASIVGAHAFQATRWTVAGETPEPTGNHHPSIAPYGLFDARDGQVQIAVGSPSQWTAFANALQIDPLDERFVNNYERVAHRGDLIELIQRRLSEHTCSEVLEVLSEGGVPAGRVRSIAEVYEWEQTRSQGLVITVNHPSLGEIELPGPALRFDDNVYGGVRKHHTAPPALGEHNEAIDQWLQIGAADPLVE